MVIFVYFSNTTLQEVQCCQGLVVNDVIIVCTSVMCEFLSGHDLTFAIRSSQYLCENMQLVVTRGHPHQVSSRPAKISGILRCVWL